LAFAPDGKAVAVACRDGSVRLGGWEAAKPAVRGALERQPQEVVSLAFTPDGKALVAVSPGGRFVVWSASGEKLREKRLPLPAHQVAFPADLSIVATTNTEGTLFVLRSP
jgi:hypothetical protein